ncbi:uncharacterized protein LOC132644182 [Lycium barbarum]|uniref:uncharacterized protein LOC132644182 n=1 Tax=Lycium barbarum TaxID=112863 RepID=UPI00293E849D|nr:uncharacterized protein LOC132644182 [Lycium barbarum]
MTDTESDDGMMEETGYVAAICPPLVQGNTSFHVNNTMLHLLNTNGLFGGLHSDDQNRYLMNFIGKKRASVEKPIVIEEVPENNEASKSKEVVKEVPRALPHVLKPSPPFLQRLAKKADDGKFIKFIEKLKQLSINIPLLEALEKMSGYAKFIKDLVTKRRQTNARCYHHCSSIVTKALVQKKKDPRAFTISCTIGAYKFSKALCDLGASINLMPLAIFNKLGLGTSRPTTLRLLMADRTVKRQVGILVDVLVMVDRFIFLADFVILDCVVDFEVPIILGRPFLATGRALIDVKRGDFKLRMNNKQITFHIYKSMKQPADMSACR